MLLLPEKVRCRLDRKANNGWVIPASVIEWNTAVHELPSGCQWQLVDRQINDRDDATSDHVW